MLHTKVEKALFGPPEMCVHCAPLRVEDALGATHCTQNVCCQMDLLKPFNMVSMNQQAKIGLRKLETPKLF